MKIKKSAFDFTHEKKFTCAPGYLVPILCEPCIPGDVWKGRADILLRAAPLTFPIYQKFDIYTHTFFVPNRLVWDNWQEFISPSAPVTSQYVPPTFPVVYPTHVGSGEDIDPRPNVIDYSRLKPGSLADFMGIGLDPSSSDENLNVVNDKLPVSLLPFRAYQLIYNEFFRDQDLQEPVSFMKSDTVDGKQEVIDLFTMRQRNWEKDYFTTARPWAQKGSPAQVSVPTSLNWTGSIPEVINPTSVYDSETGANAAGGQTLSTMTTAGQTVLIGSTDGPLKLDISTGYDPVGQFTIEDLRYANSLQRWLERNARAGSRYIESIKAHFGVRVPDYRLQRPEFLGSSKQALVISEVLNQTAGVADNPVGLYSGHGISVGQHGYKYHVQEHGYIMQIMSVVPRVSYMNIMRKDLFKTDRFDFFWPDFAHLGEQEIQSYELNNFFDHGNSNDHLIYDEVFGYTQRYAEYKFIPSTVHGQFRADPSLMCFTAARTGGNLDGEWITVGAVDEVADTDIDRVFALDPDEFDPFLVSVHHNISALRPIPRLSVPGSHFI